MEEQSRIAQLEEELSRTRAEMETLRVRPPGSAAAAQALDSETLAAGRQETEALTLLVEKQTQEICELKLKVQRATKENMDMMDAWKVTSQSQAGRKSLVEKAVHPASSRTVLA